MRIVEPFNPTAGKFNSLCRCRNAIFLAGPCPRSDFADDWRHEAFSVLEQLGFDGTVITPTNSHFKRMTAEFGFTQELAREKQVAWERAAMHIASAIVFWIPRDAAHPARTTNYEFGEWYKKPHVFVGWPDGAEHNEYMACKLKEQKKTYFNTLGDTLAAAVDALRENAGPWFTSDTHFSQQRTLELSRRPFADTVEMDYEMISNWNKRVTMHDEVVHAGDFIDPEKVDMLKSFLSFLNFKTLHWVLGNYDRKIAQQIEQAAREAEKSAQATLDAIQASSIARDKERTEAGHWARKSAYAVDEEHFAKMAEIEKAKRESFAEAIKSVIASVGPDLAKALSNKANAELLATATKNMSPYAIANGASVADTVDKLMRGTTLEGVLGGLGKTGSAEAR